MENGQSYDDPSSEDALYLLNEDIAAVKCLWVIVEKVSDRRGGCTRRCSALRTGRSRWSVAAALRTRMRSLPRCRSGKRISC